MTPNPVPVPLTMIPQAYPLWMVSRPVGVKDGPATYELVLGWVPDWDGDVDRWIYLPVTPMKDGGFGERCSVGVEKLVNFTVTPPPPEAATT